MDTNQILGTAASVLAIAGSIPYILSMIKGTTRPHIFSWLLWGVFNAIGGVAQMMDGGGPGAWVNLISAVLCWVVTVMGLLQKGERDIVRSDWIAFTGAVVAIIPWALTKDPLWSVIIITIIDMLAFYPTFRKSWYKPQEEALVSYGISATKHVLGIAALANYSITTVLFSASLVLTNSAFIAMTLYRRCKLAGG